MQLGAFSISLNVSDIQRSKAFYGALGFEVFAGDESENWLILRNGEAIIGLFQGMLEKNTLTFNPPDVRAIQKSLKSKGVSFEMEADESTDGPASAFLFDPDGNPVLLDQHAK